VSDSWPVDPASFAAASRLLRERTGVVIPVYFPAGQDQRLAVALLADTVAACLSQLSEPAHLCLSVDGANHGREPALELAGRFGVQCVVVPDNRGKLHALRHGAARLVGDLELDYLVTVDMDGDHFANELVSLVRAAEFARHRGGLEEVLVIGSRVTKHRPMGFLRGELEELADRVLLDALAYDAAMHGRPLRLELATAVEEYPDFHSGYKLFTRAAAAAVFLAEPRLCGATEDAYYRHGCEAVMTVEALQAGAHLALVRRSTLNEQPVSSFGQLHRARLVADKMIWPCRRLQVPLPFADQWLRNHLPRLLLTTLVPQGKEELVEIHRLVLDDLGAQPGKPVSWGPLFV
jgi:hypothetical protein